jgi:hypothetical protein
MTACLLLASHPAAERDDLASLATFEAADFAAAERAYRAIAGSIAFFTCAVAPTGGRQV